METLLLSLVILVSSALLTPARTWVPPDMPVNVEVKGDGPLALALTEFNGRWLEPDVSPNVEAGKTVDVRTIFPQVNNSGTYVLFVVPRGAKDTKAFQGTPLVLGVRENKKRGAPPSSTSPRGDTRCAPGSTCRPRAIRSVSSPPVPCRRKRSGAPLGAATSAKA